jgi:SseB protein N-terminal domain
LGFISKRTIDLTVVAASEALGEKETHMSLPTLVGRDGRRALAAFTCLDALARWRPGARPVPAPGARVWPAAVTDSCAAAASEAARRLGAALMARLRRGLAVALVPRGQPAGGGPGGSSRLASNAWGTGGAALTGISSLGV